MPTRSSGGDAPASSQNTNFTLDPNAMYPRRETDTGATLHAHACKMAFGRFDLRCHRCVELRIGREPREGWYTTHLHSKLGTLQRRFQF